MQAIICAHYGDTNSLSLQETDDPTLKPGHLLIDNYASSVNPIDWKIRSWQLKLITGLRRPPAILGSDFAGIIKEMAKPHPTLAVGDRVYGFVNPRLGGAYATQLITPMSNVALIPDSLSFTQAATLPIAALTAWQALMHLGQLKAGMHVIINGCSGGVGHFALQIARAKGAHVVGVCSEKNHVLARELGANEVIDYSQDPTLSSTSVCDLFFDTVARFNAKSARHLLKPNGRYISTLPHTTTLLLGLLNPLLSKKQYTILVKPNSTDLEQLNKLINKGQLNPIIEHTYALGDIPQAHQQSEQHRVVGKLEIDMQTHE